MANVWAENRQGGLKVNIENLIWFGHRILEILSLESTSVSIVVSDAGGIQELNRRYLGRDRPTNIISFPMREGEPIAGDAAYLGDIVLSADAARKEAAEYGYTEEEMMLLYLVHGILHLSGYNHEDVSEKEVRRMETKQAEVFESLSPYLAEHPIEVADSEDYQVT